MKRKLTPKQQKFADIYIETGNAMQSAIEAGYSDNYAKAQSSKMLENVGIKSYIENHMEKISQGHIMSAQEAMESLTRIATGEEKETVFVSGIDGVEEHTRVPDPKTRISAIKEILKRYPGNDKLVEQQVRKLTAEADIAEAKAVQITNDNDNQMDSIDKLLGLIEEGSNDDNQIKNTTE